MPIDPRITDLARHILNHSMTADDVPMYDRPAVQACLVAWWLERTIKRRFTGTTPARVLRVL